MYITNLTNARLGINGLAILNPKEVNRYIPSGDPTLMVRIYKMQAAGLISVANEEGLTKVTPPLKTVKLLAVEEESVTKKPRSIARKRRKQKEDNSETEIVVSAETIDDCK